MLAIVCAPFGQWRNSNGDGTIFSQRKWKVKVWAMNGSGGRKTIFFRRTVGKDQRIYVVQIKEVSIVKVDNGLKK